MTDKAYRKIAEGLNEVLATSLGEMAMLVNGRTVEEPVCESCSGTGCTEHGFMDCPTCNGTGKDEENSHG